MLDHISSDDAIALTRPHRRLYQRYYDLFNDIFDLDEYKYVWATFGDVKPMTFTNYPLLNPIINYIVGQFQSQPLAFSAYKVNSNAVSERLDLEAELLFLKMIKPYWDKFQEATGMELTLDERMEVLPDDIKTFMSYDYRDLQEKTVTDGLKYILAKHNVQSQFAQMLYDLIITGDTFGCIEYIDGDPVPMRRDPRVMIIDRPSQEFVYSIIGQDWHPQYGFEERYMNLQDVLYEYEYYMTDEDKKKVKDNVNNFILYGDSFFGNTSSCKYYYTDNSGVKIRVLSGHFLARNNVAFPSEFNEATGEPVSSEDGSYTESVDIMDVYEGVKIGADVYCKMQRKKNILRDAGNYRKAQVDYFGAFTRFGLYSKCYQLQILYNIIMSHIEFAVNQAGGKAITVYLDDIPVGDGGRPEDKLTELAYQMKVQGFIVKQRKEGAPPSGYHDDYQQVDFGMSSTIINLMQFKVMIEQTAARMTGVSPDQLGFTNPYQTARATESNLVQGNTVLQPIYFVMSKVIEQALQKTAEAMKIVWKENDVRNFVMGDMGLNILQIAEEFSLCDYGVFCRNSYDDQQKMNFYMSMGQQVLATDATMIKEIIKMSNAGSAIEAEKILENGIDAIRQLQAMRAEQESRNMEMMAQSEAEKIRQKDVASQRSAESEIEGRKIAADAVIRSAIIRKEGIENVQDAKREQSLDERLMDSMSTEKEKDQL